MEVTCFHSSVVSNHELLHDGQCAPDSRHPSQICYRPDSSTRSGWSSVCKMEDKRASPIQDLKSGYTSTIQNLAPVPAHVRCIHPESHGAVSNPMEWPQLTEWVAMLHLPLKHLFQPPPCFRNLATHPDIRIPTECGPHSELTDPCDWLVGRT